MEQRRTERILLILLLLLAAGVFGAGINWGLPGKDIDRFLFGERTPWTGKEILELLPTDSDERRGADVDATPLSPSTQPTVLNATDQQRAEIVRRYRLFSYQPDEMITLMSLSRMKPSEGNLDPKLYQYGGLWIYPVGALLKATSMVGLVQLRSDQAFYLDHPAEFGKFYVVMRAYVVMWGLIGVWAIFWIARRFTDNLFVAFAATVCCIFLPVVVNMAHEAKPHLPGAVLTLLAMMAAYRFVGTGKTQWGILAGVLCGAAFGMIISAVTSFILLPAMVLLRKQPWRQQLAVCAIAVLAGLVVHGLTNPYVVKHLLTDRSLLWSNLGNSKAMYTAGNGFTDGITRLSEGCTLQVLIVGTLGAIVFLRRAYSLGRLMALACLPILVQFFVLAAGKPSEYARFAIVPCICLTICGAMAIVRVFPQRGWMVLCIGMLSLSIHAASYVWHFGRDSVARTPRIIAAERIREMSRGNAMDIHVQAEPAPYCLPPIDLFKNRLVLGVQPPLAPNSLLLTMEDHAGRASAPYQYWSRPKLLPTPISWAAKPMRVRISRDGGTLIRED